MEYSVKPAEGRKVTNDLFLRLVRMSQALSVEILPISIEESIGSAFTHATVEIFETHEVSLRQIFNIALVDGFRIEPVPDQASGQ